MTGAGFGGCAVALVRAAVAKDFADIVSQGYTDETGITPQIYICEATNGAEVI
jgi:galactokinase